MVLVDQKMCRRAQSVRQLSRVCSWLGRFPILIFGLLFFCFPVSLWADQLPPVSNESIYNHAKAHCPPQMNDCPSFTVGKNITIYNESVEVEKGFSIADTHEFFGCHQSGWFKRNQKRHLSSFVCLEDFSVKKLSTLVVFWSTGSIFGLDESSSKIVDEGLRRAIICESAKSEIISCALGVYFFNYNPYSCAFFADGYSSIRLHLVKLPFHQASLFFNGINGADGDNDAHNCNDEKGPIVRNGLQQTFAPARLIRLAVGTVLFLWAAWPSRRGLIYRGGLWGWLGIVLASVGLICLFWDKMESSDNQHRSHYQEFHGNTVTQKRFDKAYLLYYSNDMANVLNTGKQIAVISALAEGSSIRSIERITGVHRDTIMRLGVKVGKGCAALMDVKMRDLDCNRLEMDEIWGFVGKKDRNVRMGDSSQVGSVWTFCAIDADTKLVPAFKVGGRDTATANAFVQDVANRMRNRVQISTDGLRSYVEAIEKSFGADVDFAQIVKTYGREEVSDNRRYSAPEFVSSEKKVITGNPNQNLISTSYVERLNATTRLHMRRLTRLTLAFSKKRENFEAAVALHFAYYNFVKRHNTLRCTPAMAAGVESGFLSVADLVEAA
jgi:IS1 family transposase